MAMAQKDLEQCYSNGWTCAVNKKLCFAIYNQRDCLDLNYTIHIQVNPVVVRCVDID